MPAMFLPAGLGRVNFYSANELCGKAAMQRKSVEVRNAAHVDNSVDILAPSGFAQRFDESDWTTVASL